MSHNQGQSSIKALLHNYGKHHKTWQLGMRIKLPCMMMLRTHLTPPQHCSPRHHTVQPQCTRPWWQNSHWIQWWYPPKESGAVAGALLATSGQTWSTRVYHKPTYTHWGASTPHWTTIETSPGTASRLNL